MAGGTHAFDMIKRLRENENLRKLNYFKTGKRYSASGRGTTLPDEHALTTGEADALRRSIRRDQRTQTRRQLFVLLLSVVLLGALILITLQLIRS